MKKSLLEIIRQTTAELGLPAPSTVIFNNDTLIIQLVGLCQALCEELAEGFDWQALTNTYSFDTTNGTAGYQTPDDFSRIVSETMWNGTSNLFISGGLTPLKYGINKTSTINNSSIYQTYRLLDGEIVIQPTPTSTQSIIYEYISNWCIYDTTTHLYKKSFTTDNDTVVFNDRLVINGLKLKFKEANGLSTSTSAYDFEQILRNVRGHDQGGQRLSLTPSRRNRNCNIPDGNWML